MVILASKSGTPAGTRTRARGLGNRCSIHLSYRGTISKLIIPEVN